MSKDIVIDLYPDGETPNYTRYASKEDKRPLDLILSSRPQQPKATGYFKEGQMPNTVTFKFHPPKAKSKLRKKSKKS